VSEAPQPDKRVLEPNPDRTSDAAQGGRSVDETVSYESTGAAQDQGASWQLPGGRYHVVGEIARGGMGVVLRAIDVDLQRPLAVKVMLERGMGTAGEERFLEEARITGQLQHPGIPPVHEIGRLADGRPFFAMKLIEGRTLAELLRERAGAVGGESFADGSGTGVPSHNERATLATDLPRFLKIFEQIAQTLAYAHSQGIIHRDLKPLNVMVGAFGEVQVMDWGLARRLRGRESFSCAQDAIVRPDADRTKKTPDPLGPAVDAEATKEIPSALEETRTATPAADQRNQPADAGRSLDRLTRPGQAMGTPAYMPPEQARGEIEALDERADVFGLGAILCEMLTSKPPYVGRDRDDVFRRAQQADLADAFQRLAACGADAELIALANACLALLRAARPRDAGVVAAKLTAYLESVEARLRQAELERAQAQLKAQEERKRRKLTMAWSLTAAVAITVVTGGWLWFQNKLAVQETERRQTVLAALDKVDDLSAQTRWKEAELVLDQATAQLGDAGPADLRQRLEQARRETRLLADLDEARMASSQALERAASAAAYERAFAAFGLDVLRTEPQQTAQRLMSLRPELRTATALALDDWVFCVEDLELQERLRRMANDVDDDPWRRRFRQARNRNALVTLEQETLTAELPIVSLVLLGSALEQRGASEAAVRVLRRAVRIHPADFWAHYELEGALRRQRTGQLKADEERVGHLRAAVAARPQAAPAHSNLGLALHEKGDVEGAIVAFRRAIELDPKFALAHYNLALALRDNGDVEGAIAAYRKAIELDPKDALAHTNLGAALRANGDVEGAIAAYRKAIELDPTHAIAHYNLGNALSDQGHVDGAIAAFRKVIELDPKDAMAHLNLGKSLYTKEDVEGAIAAYRKAIELDPEYALAHCNLGLALRTQGHFADALASLRRGHELGSHQPGSRTPSAQWVRETERLVELEAKLAALLKGELQPANAGERLEYAQVCLIKKFHAGAARLYIDAFAADPKLADDLNAGHRYAAARSAALAGCGQGQDAAKLDDKERAGWRRQALDWLRADLKARTALLERHPQTKDAAARALAHWQTDPDLAGVRDETAVKKLPADEQPAWRQLWADVAALRKRAETEAGRRGKE
jgi:serine/threonine protein kinase/Tfp pilus assembly protein PilF